MLLKFLTRIMAANTFIILCPPKRCSKCRRMQEKLTALIDREDLDAEIKIVNELQQMLTYRTWILPTLIINDKVVARGYFPKEERVMELIR